MEFKRLKEYVWKYFDNYDYSDIYESEGRYVFYGVQLKSDDSPYHFADMVEFVVENDELTIYIYRTKGDEPIVIGGLK